MRQIHYALTLGFLTYSAIISAQHSGLISPAHSHEGGYPCGVGLAEGELIKTRMLENRRLAADGLLSPQRRNTTYIPTTFHIVGNSSGQGYVDIENVFAMLCDMNADYADQNIQFYIKDSVRYLNNNNIYNNATSFNSALAMNSNKVAGTMNVYMSVTVQNAAASFYSPVGDYIFIINSEVSGISNTATHEVGHFFSLNHTFYGWEGVDVEATYPNNAPNTVGGRAVERVARSGSGANCSSSADGFCDTPADYYSDRVPCPYTGTAKDPNGVPIAPDVSNYMSYFFNQCVTRFSNEQKTAVSLDLVRRNWSALPPPSVIGAPNAAGISAITPASGSDVGTGGSSPADITLSWTADPNAIGYVLVLHRMLLGSPVSEVFRVVVRGTNYTFNPSILPSLNSQYAWEVRPFNLYNTCSGFTNFFNFRATTSIVSSTDGLETQASAWEFKLLGNPVQGNTAQLLVNSPEAAQGKLQVYGLDGRVYLQQNALALQQGDNVFNLELEGFSAGLYYVVLHHAQGTETLKMIKQ